MSDEWGPSASPPPPPPGGRQQHVGGYQAYSAAAPQRSGAFRDTLVVAGLAVAGVVGLVIWSGGDVATSGDLQSGGSVPAIGSPDAPTAQADPGAETAQAPSANQAPAVAPGTLDPNNPAAYEAMVAAQDALIGVLPVPAGATEMPPDGAGIRTWTVAGTDWESLRDGYLDTLRQQGFTLELEEPFNDGANVGELYRLTDPSNTISLQLAVGTFNGQSGIEVTRQ